eukprot:1138563-Pelagomonas_calceolata.AAC.7
MESEGTNRQVKTKQERATNRTWQQSRRPAECALQQRNDTKLKHAHKTRSKKGQKSGSKAASICRLSQGR